MDSLVESICDLRGVSSVLLSVFFTDVFVFNANSAAPDQAPHSTASGLVLHVFFFLPGSIFWKTIYS